LHHNSVMAPSMPIQFTEIEGIRCGMPCQWRSRHDVRCRGLLDACLARSLNCWI
jgi:hypothetical protein